MNNNYEYIKVDPKVIQMLGGSDDVVDPMSSSFGDDLSVDDVNSYMSQPSKGMFKESMLPGFEPNVNPNSTDNSEILKQILQELKEIKVILAGK